MACIMACDARLTGMGKETVRSWVVETVSAIDLCREHTALQVACQPVTLWAGEVVVAGRTVRWEALQAGRRFGVACGGDSTWTDASSVEDAVWRVVVSGDVAG